MKKTSIILILWSLTWLIAACTLGNQSSPEAEEVQAEETTLIVFAAASLTDAFTALGQEFAAANPGVEILFNFAGSQQLAHQLGQGAAADLFASANQRQMEVVIAAGRVRSGTPQIFARNRLVVIIPQDNVAQVSTLADLAKPGIKVVLAAKEVPVGQYALDFLDKAQAAGSLGVDYRAAVLQNVVSYEENVRTVLAKVKLGEADAGVIYASDMAAAADVQRIEIPDSLNTLATYPIAVMQDAPHSELAQKLVDYILSPAGQQILERHGFIRAE